jgi:pentapeptide repeat protein
MLWLIPVSLALLGVGFCLWWWVPKLQMRSVTAADPKARADIEDNFRKTVGQALGGVFVLLAAGVAYWGTFQTLQANQQSARDLLISNQVSKAFEQLGSNGVVRLGGIYALEGVMNASEQYHKPVLEALCAFVRERTGTETGDGPPATDIQAALTVIGRRAAAKTEAQWINLANLRIPKADLVGADLADFRAVDLSGVDLRGARLLGDNLTGANLTGADLGDAILYDTFLTRAALTRTKLNRAVLTAVDLTDARLNGADLTKAFVSQTQLDKACGTDVKLDPGLAIKPC